MAVPAQMLEAAQWAADQFGGGIPRRNAFVAWWACEDGYKWPTNGRNNPGNMRPPGSYAGVVGITPRVGPLGGFFIFDTPANGVAAMVHEIQTSTHYGGIRTALAGGNAQAIATAVGKSPWGTNSPCMLSALKSISSSPTPTGTGWQNVNPLKGSGGAPVTAPGAPAQAPQAGPVVLAIANARTASLCGGQVTILEPGNAIQTKMIPIPKGDIPGIATGCTQCPAGWAPAVVGTAPSTVLGGIPIIGGLIAGEWVDPSTLPPGTPNACVAPGVQVGDVPLAGEGIDAVSAGLSLLANLPTEIQGILTHLGEGLVIAVLVLLGLYVLATADD